MSERTPEVLDPHTRARQLRRRMLVLAKIQRDLHKSSEGWFPAKLFLQVTDDRGVKIADERECESLLSDLLELKLITEWHPLGMSGRVTNFYQRRFTLTDRGYALWSGELDAIPSIADERLGD